MGRDFSDRCSGFSCVLQSVKTACVAVSKSMRFGVTFLTSRGLGCTFDDLRLTNGSKTLNAP